MNKKLIVPILISSFLIPAFTLAQDLTVNNNSLQPTTASANTTNQTSAQVFTACSQTAIGNRDKAITISRTAYNTTMASLLSTRTDAEKVANTLTDTIAKKTAMKTALETYKKSVKLAQETLTKARKEAWLQFETDGKACRETKRIAHEKEVADKKIENEKKKAESKTLIEKKKAEAKIIADKKKAEAKTKIEEIKKTSTTKNNNQ